MKKTLLNSLFLFAGLIVSAQTISIQGVLRDENKRTVDDGFYQVTFSIYDEPDGGTALWTDTYANLQTRNGVFQVNLGEQNSIASLDFDVTYYVGVAVEGNNEMTPRIQLTTFPYAMAINGNSNKFPSNGNVEITEDSLILENGTFLLETGDVVLDEGVLRLKGGDGRIVFNDGTSLNTAEFGGPSGSVSNPSGTTINADTEGTGAGSIHLQIDDATKFSIDNAGATLVWDGASTNINFATAAGDLYVEDDLEVDDDIYLNSQLIDAANTAFYVDPGGASSIARAIIWDGSATVNKANGNYRLYVEDDIEVDDDLYVGDAVLIGVGTNSTADPTGHLDVRGDEVRIWDGSASVNDATAAGELYVEFDIETDNDLYVADAVLIGHGTNSTASATGHLDVRGDEVRIWDGSASVSFATGTGDLYVEDDLEVDDDIYVYGSTHYQNNSTQDITYTSGSNLQIGTLNGTTFDEAMRLDGDGHLGINNTSPRAPLHVAQDGTGVGVSGSRRSFFYASSSGLNAESSTTTIPGVAAVFEGDVIVSGSTSFIIATNSLSTSDERIKKIIGRSNKREDLDIINKIKITDYEFIDDKTKQAYKKVIAQELREVFPQAVKNDHRRVIPDVYDYAKEVSLQDKLLTISMNKAHGFVEGDKIDGFSPTSDYLQVEVVEVVDAHTFQIRSEEVTEEFFVYGKWVDDFHVVDYDAISMLNVSATQELHNQLQALQKENADLKAQVSELAQLKAEVASLKALEAKVNALLNPQPQKASQEEGEQIGQQ